MHQILVGYIYLEDYIVHAYIYIILYPNLVLKYNRYTENAQVGSLPSILTCLGSIFGVIVILSGVRFSSINREFPLNTSSTEATNSGGSRISQIGGKKPIIYQDFYRKLHENKRMWAEGARDPSAPFGPTND